jgi:hypothetical protein
MTSLTAPTAPDEPLIDPREFQRLSVHLLLIDQRKQRECDPEKVAKIANEFDWCRFEAITVSRSKERSMYDVVEGQHRVLAARQLSWKEIAVPCLILPAKTTDKQQSQIALDIVQGRRGHSAYEQWRLRYNAGHPHEIFATTVLEKHGLRVGKAPSAMSIGAVATVRRIVHGGGFSPELGSELLDKTLAVITTAFPTHDHESNVSRWDRYLMLAVSTIIVRWPDYESARLARSLRVRPAGPWVNLGQGAEGPSPDAAILSSLTAEYNRGRRRGRFE